VIWFDAHGDFNTPETTISGFFDGMALAMLLGRSFRGLLGSEYHPIPEAHAIHVGGRDFDLEEWKQLQQSSVMVISPDEARESGIDRALSVLEQKAKRVHIHFDLDALDSSIGSANQFAVPNGLSLSDAQRIIKQIRKRLTLVSATVSSYDPTCDAEGTILQAGTQIMRSLVD
ncbi:MAG: arginase family protein, partial [Anaerolineae bacterium]